MLLAAPDSRPRKPLFVLRTATELLAAVDAELGAESAKTPAARVTSHPVEDIAEGEARHVPAGPPGSMRLQRVLIVRARDRHAAEGQRGREREPESAQQIADGAPVQRLDLEGPRADTGPRRLREVVERSREGVPYRRQILDLP